MDSGKFAVADTSGNTTIGGTLDAGAATITDHFTVQTESARSITKLFEVTKADGDAISQKTTINTDTDINGTLKVSSIKDAAGVNVGGLYGIIDEISLSNDPDISYTPVLSISMGDGSPIVITIYFVVDANTNLKFDVILISDKTGGYSAIVAGDSGMKDGMKIYQSSNPQIKATYTPDSVDNPLVGKLGLALSYLYISDPGTLVYQARGNISSITPVEPIE
jgi:hypothetical protein